MNNSQDPKFSKFSYVDKDFASIYPDLLDLATTLTDKWHPANSNESDPGVVLLKEGAFMADHINYNTDKNILEAFLPTATQESSVRDLVERGGYLPDYYVSGKGKVNFTCVINDESKPLINSIIPSLTLNITNKDGTVWYVQTDPLKIDESGHGNCNFIEGYVEDLEINGSKNITLENIDDDLRLYLPVKNVAQNGIFIRNSEINEKTDWSYDLWKREVFLNVLPQYTKAYRVEYDSEKDKVYIEFPSDISAIIGSGLNIKYIVSSGLRGNVPANHLTVISSPTSIKIGENDYSMSNFTLYNPGAIDNGKDPETIKEMYHNFKETVGTFNTLVTCQDYSNAIKSMVDDNNIHIVSNAVVTDCTNDYSNAVNIVTYDEYGKYIKPALRRDLEKIFEEINGKYSGSISISDVETFSKFVSLLQKYEGMKNNDLKLCALQAYNAGKYQWDKPEACIETTYKPILPQYTLDAVKDGEITLTGIKESLKDYKCVSTSFKSKLDGEIYYFKIKTPLHIQVTTYEKITSKTELESIQQSIYRTITEKYNSGMIEFGDSLDLDEVYQAILNADERIKNIYITQEDDETETVAVRLSSENNEPILKEDVIDIATDVGKDLLIELVAKNVLAGRLCLFNFITDFKYNYGQSENIFYGQSDDKLNPSTSSSSSIDDKINSINTNTKIFISNLDTSNDQFTILPTDYVSINISDNFRHSPIKNNSTVIISLGESEITLTYDSTKMSKSIVLTEDIGVTNITGRDIELNNDALGLIFYQLESKENRILSPEFSTTINTDNHYLYLAKPNYMDDQVFPTYCYYKLVGNISYGQEGFEDIVIPANADTVIPNGYTLYLSYKKDGVNEIKAYPAGTTVLSTIDISLKDFYQAPSNEQDGDRKKLSESNRRYLSNLGVTNGDGFRIISAGNSIRTRILLRTSIKNRVLPCYWIRSNPGCTLFNYIVNNDGEIEPTDSNTFIYNGEVCTILNNNEYFFYTDQERHDLVMFGPGTMISITEDYAVRVKTKDNYSWGINPEDQLSLEGIETKGISAGIPFIELNLTPESLNNTYELNLTEMEITTLDKNDSFTLSLTNKEYIDNISEFLDEPLEGFSFGFGTTWYPIFKAGRLTYSLTEDQENISGDISTDIGVFIKTEFLISSNPILLNNYKDDNCYTTEEIDYNIDEVISSGELVNDPVKVMSNIDLSGLSSSSIAMNSNNYDVNLRLMKYKAESIIFHKTDDEDDKGYLYPGDIPVSDNYKETSDYEELSFSSNYNLGSSFTLTVPFFFNRGCKTPGVIDPTAGENNDTAPDLHNNYIIPVLLSSDYKKLAGNLSAQVFYPINETSTPLNIYEFGKESLGDKFTFNTNTNFYQLTFDIDNTEIKEDTELKLVFSYNSDNAYNPNFKLEGSTVKWNTGTSFNSIFLYKSGVNEPLEIETSGEYTISNSGDYGYPGEYVFTLETDTDIYLFEFDLTSEGSSTYQRTSSQSLQSSYEMIVKVLPLKVYNGANKKIALSDNSLDDIVKKMNYLVYNSSEPNTNIYYINEPDNTIDIQDEEVLIPNTTVFNPNFLYDKNNIANNQVLPMIDIKNTEIFLTKSVKGYRE